MNQESRYLARGVSSSKEDVHSAIQRIDKGLFPNSFCKILPDILGMDDSFCNIIHADGAGTKSSLAYIYWKETGDLSVWKGIAQDSIVMNTDDLLCTGITDQMMLSSTIGRNKNLIPGEVIKAIIEGTEEFLELLRGFGVNIHSGGGETADIGDLVRTIVVDSTLVARTARNLIIDNSKIREGDVIIGLASSGKALYETEFNSGIGSNGLTSARHDIFQRQYVERFPESFDPMIPKEYVYSGKFSLTEESPVKGINFGKLALSPTRTYLPVIKSILQLFRPHIHGMIHCTGGGQTKVLNFIGDLRIIKNNLFETPAIFKIIQESTDTPFKEMYKVFNMGHRLEIYVPEQYAGEIISISEDYNIEARIVGHVESADTKSVQIETKNGIYVYP